MADEQSAPPVSSPLSPQSAPVPADQPPVTAFAGVSEPVSARAGDADRDRVVALLRDHCVAGRLTLDEFSERTGAALAARTEADLDAVLADLPGLSRPAAGPPRRRARRWIVTIMGESESTGRWRLGSRAVVAAVMGQCHVDLSRAEIEGPETVITAVSVMGQIDIVAPEGIEVDVTGLSIMGRKATSMRDVPVLHGSPRVVIRAFPIMGEVTVRSRPPSTETAMAPRSPLGSV